MKIVNKIIENPLRESDYYPLWPIESRKTEIYVQKHIIKPVADAFTSFTSYAINNKPVLAFYSITFEDGKVEI